MANNELSFFFLLQLVLRHPVDPVFWLVDVPFFSSFWLKSLWISRPARCFACSPLPLGISMSLGLLVPIHTGAGTLRRLTSKPSGSLGADIN